MAQNHSLPAPMTGLASIDLVLDSSSAAQWSLEAARACMVFVHGYGGTAVKTWGGLAELAMEHRDFAGVDLLFLGYPSRSSRAAYNVGLIYRTLEQLAENPRQFSELTYGPAREPDFCYDRIVLVGHSLGGALVRAVAQAAKRQGKPWAETLRLALFAPAHMGADVISLVKLAGGVSRWASPAMALLMAKEQALIDLDPASQFLQNLQREAAEIGCHPTTQASLVVHAQDDPVVSPNSFYQDPPCIPYANRNHVSCCKPEKVLFETPVRHIAGVKTAA